MSRTSLVIGLLVSLAGHVVALWPDDTDVLPAAKKETPAGAESPAEDEQAAVRVDVTTPPPPAVAQRREQRPAPPPRTPALDRLIRPRADEDETIRGAEATADDNEPAPTLRIEWRSPRQMLAVARALDLRVVAVDPQQTIVGQIDIHDAPQLVPFNGVLNAFSNRIRTLPNDYFGSLIGEGADMVAALWILVPSAVDRMLIDQQRTAIEQAGRAQKEVRITEGHFERKNGTYRLIITNLI